MYNESYAADITHEIFLSHVCFSSGILLMRTPYEAGPPPSSPASDCTSHLNYQHIVIIEAGMGFDGNSAWLPAAFHRLFDTLHFSMVVSSFQMRK